MAHPGTVSPLERLPEVSAGGIAYLLFTSGSTGTPKGVPVTHGNVRAFLDADQERYRLTPDDRLTQTFDQTFDLSVFALSVFALSVFDLFMAWENGARLCSVEPIELLPPSKYLERNGINGVVLGALRGRRPAQARWARAGQHAHTALEPVLRRGAAPSHPPASRRRWWRKTKRM
ncbi:AMP-binding protein [Streptomyces sp. NPDC052496]|uniref:AMP-binding protein n=1 Tax=Streptomyces sp. NPDC052496 TaxID=3154951 RepID=UPI003434E7F8